MIAIVIIIIIIITTITIIACLVVLGATYAWTYLIIITTLIVISYVAQGNRKLCALDITFSTWLCLRKQHLLKECFFFILVSFCSHW